MKIKKIIFVLLIAAVIFGLVAYSNKRINQDNNKQAEETPRPAMFNGFVLRVVGQKIYFESQGGEKIAVVDENTLLGKISVKGSGAEFVTLKLSDFKKSSEITVFPRQGSTGDEFIADRIHLIK